MAAQTNNVELLQMRDMFVAKMHGAFQHAYLHQHTVINRGAVHTNTEFEIVATLASYNARPTLPLVIERILEVCKVMWPEYMITSCTITQQLVRESVITDFAQSYLTITLVEL